MQLRFDSLYIIVVKIYKDKYDWKQPRYCYTSFREAIDSCSGDEIVMPMQEAIKEGVIVV